MNTILLLIKRNSLIVQAIILMIIVNGYVSFTFVKIILLLISLFSMHLSIGFRGIYSDSDIEGMIILNVILAMNLFE